MRLQAEITNETISKIALILKSYTKDDIVLYFTETSVSFYSPMDNSIGIWIKCDISSCFSKSMIKSKQDNTIILKVEATQLAQALSFEQSSSIRVILSQLDSFIFLQLISKSLDGLKQLEHRIPIILLNQQSMNHYAEPTWESPTMLAKLPNLKNLIEWCSKIQSSIAKYLTISIIRNSDSGQLEVGLRAENEAKMVLVYTRFSDMRPNSTNFQDANHLSESDKSGLSAEFDHSITDINDRETDKNDLVECDVTVELKKFLKILKVHQLEPMLALLYVHDKKLLRLHFETASYKISYALNGVQL